MLSTDRLASPTTPGNRRLNFQIAIKVEEPQKFKGWALESTDRRALKL